MLALAFAAALTATPPPAADFAARVQRAKLAEAAMAGTAYQKALWGRIGRPVTDAYKACLAANHDDRTPFTLVFDVDAAGKPQRLEVQPATAVASCLAGRFAAWSYPAPPATPAPYPLEVDFSVSSGK